MAALFDLLRMGWRALTGTGNTEFEELMEAGDVSAALDLMTTHREAVEQARREYDTHRHEINARHDKVVTDKSGNYRRIEKTWKLPIPYPVYINEIAVVFLYGRPVRWTCVSEDTEDAFRAFLAALRRIRFDAKVRQCKRLAGAETEAALLLRAYQSKDGRADVQARVLAAGKGDDLYALWDQYENMKAFAWGYWVREHGDVVRRHVDVFTPEWIYHCVQKSIGWETEKEANLIGKIPVIYFAQEKEWAGVEPLIAREEYIASHTADTNDYFADPTLMVSADIVRNLPEKSQPGKVLVTNNEDGVEKAARYLTWDNAPQSKREEVEWLEEQILSKTFTPKISLDSLAGVSQLSAKALRTVMLLADIKASRRKESHDELLDRVASLVTALVGKVLDVSLADQCERLRVVHEWSEPFGDDVADTLQNIARAVDAGVMSTETGLELNPLVKDAPREKERLAEEQEQSAAARLNVFGEQAAGDAAPESVET